MKKIRHLHLPRLCLVVVLAVFLLSDLPGLVGWKLPYAQPAQRQAEDTVSGISQAAPFGMPSTRFRGFAFLPIATGGRRYVPRGKIP